MTRVLLGTDLGQGVDAPSVRLVQRLRFNAAQVEAVRVVGSPIFPAWEISAGMPPIALEELIQAEEARARAVTEAVAERLGDISAGAHVLHGAALQQLLARADETGADLIAVDGHEDSPLLAALIGSVARGLVLGARQSILLAKGSREPDPTTETPVRAVLATDHSDYADACWERLVRLWPRGIEHLTILTAYPEDRLRSLEPMLPPLGISPTRAVRDQLCARSDALASRLAERFPPSCTGIDVVLSTLPVHEAIAEQMQASRADLLILGAKGHGLVERLTLGSVSFSQAIGPHPYSVLLLRV
jgi:nucleotide-binding universal stress UspA family protein